ncbi:MAG: hypothetical protein II305_08610 [Clostridia bacterium]|nr:hypothetical protein [Clostridia bacterium]
MKKNDEYSFKLHPHNKAGFIDKLKHFFKELKYAFQRFKKGYSDRDVESIDLWFFEIMPQLLNEFSCKAVSCPNEYTMEEWLEEIEKMKTLFIDAKSSMVSSEEDVATLLQQIEKHFVCDENSLNEYAKQEKGRIAKKAALELFVKHIDQLWL